MATRASVVRAVRSIPDLGENPLTALSYFGCHGDMEKYTLASLRKQFPDENSCLEFIKNARWPNGITCARCERVTKHFRIAGRKVYSCEFCATHISPTAHTIFHKSSTPLMSWFHAIFSMALTRTGVSAEQLKREIGVTYKTAWRMLDQIHKLMTQGDISLFGEVEVDETYFGGKHRTKRGRGAEGKTIVAGMLERGGQAIVKVVPDTKARTLLPMIQEHVHQVLRSTRMSWAATTGSPDWVIPISRSGIEPSSMLMATPTSTVLRVSGATSSGVLTVFTMPSAPSTSKPTWTPTSSALITGLMILRCFFSCLRRLLLPYLSAVVDRLGRLR